ncbi:MAG: AMP-binding protein [Verrucomicrobiales bacterium]|nr:AMP-binding protein [Verrucomicrobiales bacterium]
MSSRTQIHTNQLSKLRTLIKELDKGNAFYRPRLQEAGITDEISSLDEFTGKMGFTSKMDLVWDREEVLPYGSNLTYPLSQYSRYSQSSGTTRGPLPWLDTNESWSAMLDCWDQVFRAAGVETTDSIFFAFSFGPFLGFWTAYESATRRRNLSIPGGGLSSMARLRAIAAHRCDVLCCTPTYAMRLGELLEEQSNDEDMKSVALKKIIVAGEPGGSIPEVREQISRLWRGAQVFDHHGMTEVGPVTYEDPAKPMSLCVIEDAYIAEIIDRKTQKEVAEGERGELVLTTLNRIASPLLRYRTGDLVQKSYHNGQLCLEGGILGRVDDMVVIRGVNVYPTAVEKVIRGFQDVAEFQVKQTTHQSMAELEITLEPQKNIGNPEMLAKQVEKALQDAFTLRIPVSCTAPGALPRFEFKSKRWVKEDKS